MRLSRLFSAGGLSSNKTNDAKENENARTQIIVVHEEGTPVAFH